MRKRTPIGTIHILVIWSCINIKDEVGAGKTSKAPPPTPLYPSPPHSSFPPRRSTVVTLMHFFFVCVSVVSTDRTKAVLLVLFIPFVAL